MQQWKLKIPDSAWEIRDYACSEKRPDGKYLLASIPTGTWVNLSGEGSGNLIATTRHFFLVSCQHPLAPGKFYRGFIRNEPFRTMFLYEDAGYSPKEVFNEIRQRERYAELVLVD